MDFKIPFSDNSDDDDGSDDSDDDDDYDFIDDDNDDNYDDSSDDNDDSGDNDDDSGDSDVEDGSDNKGEGDLVESKEIELEYIQTDKQLADILTKPLDANRFEILRVLRPWDYMCLTGHAWKEEEFKISLLTVLYLSALLPRVFSSASSIFIPKADAVRNIIIKLGRKIHSPETATKHVKTLLQLAMKKKLKLDPLLRDEIMVTVLSDYPEFYVD
ncbi:PREDICTED: protein ecdysoneless homolog [Ipomoea nil]|uniref:protein ecdysoneless homolog n=1 Tax=Ipomoea nil TaxID=35883 RepID=UPI000900CB27|nr:PREDICTED: protein ecdysoneless homolog [Ipomoea nil]